MEPTPAQALFGAVVRPLQAFLRLQAASGIVLLLGGLGALAWVNLSPESYRAAFELPLVLGVGEGQYTSTLRALINDGLMAIFFLVVGMEIKRELVIGELDTRAKASLPAIAAMGGMLLPIAIYLAFNWDGPGERGWAIPMATDIAFCVGVLTILERRVSRALVVFVTALAIFDDIGGILVIAFFYGEGLSGPWLFGAALITVALIAMGRLFLVHGLVYAIAGAGLWWCLHHAGIHATIAGVVLGLTIPARPRRPSREVLRELSHYLTELFGKDPEEELEDEIHAIEEKLEDLQAPLQRFVHLLHPWVAFVIMPSFALANAGVSLRGADVSILLAPVTLGIVLALFLGKLIGIFVPTMLAVKLRVAPMPADTSTLELLGGSAVAGMGLTVSLFIAGLAFSNDAELFEQAKVGILLGSLISGLVGAAILRFTGTRGPSPKPLGQREIVKLERPPWRTRQRGP